MILLSGGAALTVERSLQPEALRLAALDSGGFNISNGTACDEDSPTPGTCNCSGTPMGPESWRLSKPDWFGTDLTSLWDASAIYMGENVSLSNFSGHKATMVINIASA